MDEKSGEEVIESREGVINEKGNDIIFRVQPPSWYSGSTIANELFSFSKKGIYFWLAGLGFFWGLTIIFAVVFITGELNVYLLVIWIGISGFFTIAALLDRRGSPTHPKGVQLSDKGVKVYFAENQFNLIEWNWIKNIAEIPQTSGSDNVLYSMTWIKNNKTQKGTTLTEDCASAIYLAIERRMEIAHFDNDSSFKAWNFALPGSKVMVINKNLTDEEIKYRKLRRRFLNNGAYTPVYVTEDEDIRIIGKYVRQFGKDIDVLKKIGMIALEHNFWKESAEIWRQIHLIASDDIEAMNHLGGSLIKEGKLTEGMKILDEALAKDPKSSQTLLLQSMGFYEQGMIDEAQLKLGKAVESDPNNLDALQMWFDIVTGEGGLGQAISEIDYLATTHEKAWGPYFIIGAAYFRMQKLDDSYSYYQKAMERELNETTICAGADVLNGLGRPKEVETLIENNRSILPEKSWAFFHLAHAWLIEGKNEKAKEMLETLEGTKDMGLLRSIHQLRQQFGMAAP
jgi:tetratricopeptide (TPR) repeat protein